MFYDVYIYLRHKITRRRGANTGHTALENGLELYVNLYAFLHISGKAYTTVIQGLSSLITRLRYKL